MKKSVFALAAVVATMMVTGAASAHNVPGADQGGLRLTGTFSGHTQVDNNGAPNGDPDGTGTAVVTLNYGLGQVCVDYTIHNIAQAWTVANGFTVTHIHRAPAGVNGPVILGFGSLAPLDPLAPDESGTVSRCVSANRSLIDEIRDNPSGFYAHAHNNPYFPGVVRAQLSH